MMPRPTIYYNDNCPQVCAWIRQLMFDGLIPYGVVDSRSILDVQPADLEDDTATTEIYTSWYTLSLHDALPISLPAV